MSFSVAYHDATKPPRPDSLKGWPTSMKSKSKPSDILAEPNQTNYREAVKQLVEFERESFKLLNRKTPPTQYEVLNRMKLCLECYSVVLNQLNSLDDRTRTYKENCRIMDAKGKQ